MVDARDAGREIHSGKKCRRLLAALGMKAIACRGGVLELRAKIEFWINAKQGEARLGMG